jgi:4-amino-4-deoxy-L-arabinose transferase-like glycosyltransferase
VKKQLVAVAIAVLAAAAVLVVRQLVVDRDPLDRLAGESTRSGSWYIPRGGPSILGFESPNGDAALAIDGREVVRGSGVKSQRILLEAGAHAVELTAPPGARLLWHPPGRRGANELEYVPPSSLSPDPPERAAFGAWAGASPADGLFAILLILIGLGLGLTLARGALRRVDRRAAAWAGAVFALALAVRLIDLGGAGQTFDEDVNWAAGRNYVTNGLALDFAPRSWVWNYQHPPVSKYIAGVGAQLADGYGPARALSALLVALACGLLVFIGRRLFSLRAGILAGAVAALTPHLIAHGKIVGHEAVAVFLWTAAILAALAAHDGDPGRRRLILRLVLVGVLLGLAVSSRFVNGLLAPLLGAILLINAPPALRNRTLILGAAVVPLAAIAVSVAIWPRLWDAPLVHLDAAWQKLKVPHAPEPFLGQVTNDPPGSYFAIYLVATAPLGILLAAAACAGRWRQRGALLVLLWLLAPLLVFLSPVRQDGVRYILPSLVALALAAGAGVDWLASLAARRFGHEPRIFAGVAAVLVLYLGVTCARVHPYYLDYYGEQVGGPAGVARGKKLEIAWWGEGIASAIDHVNRHAAPGAKVHKACVGPSHLTWLRGDLWAHEARRAADADWIVVYQPSWRDCPLPPDAVLDHEVSVQGAPLARVYRRVNVSRQ